MEGVAWKTGNWTSFLISSLPRSIFGVCGGVNYKFHSRLSCQGCKLLIELLLFTQIPNRIHLFDVFLGPGEHESKCLPKLCVFSWLLSIQKANLVLLFFCNNSRLLYFALKKCNLFHQKLQEHVVHTQVHFLFLNLQMHVLIVIFEGCT
jgi:hypothetical protein